MLFYSSDNFSVGIFRAERDERKRTSDDRNGKKINFHVVVAVRFAHFTIAISLPDIFLFWFMVHMRVGVSSCSTDTVISNRQKLWPQLQKCYFLAMFNTVMFGVA